jgi:indolepyruvate ferredoxin oxidoreductase alpha subunit
VIDLARMGALHREVEVQINEQCDGCGFCLQHFECPALVMDDQSEQVTVDQLVCTGCGVCLQVCPNEAIVATEASEEN